MRSPILRTSRYPTEFALLLALVLFIPLFEVPKNILLGLYAIAWIRNRYLSGSRAEFGGRWDGWDWLFGAWIASAFIVATFSGLHKNEWQAVWDVWKYVCLAWMLKRSCYVENEWRMIFAAATVSALIGTAWALASLLEPHTYPGIELHSVGHVNHSAAYIAISIGATLAAVVSFWPQLPARIRALGLAALVVFGIGILLAGSRAATVVSLAIVVLIGALWARRSKAVLLAMAIALVVFIASVQTFDKDMHRKNELAKASPHSMLNERYPLWHQAVTAWRANPWFGVGMDNFDAIDQPAVRRWVEQRGDVYEAAVYSNSSHAHSLFLTTLAERGIVGLSVVVAALFAWAVTLLRGVPRPTDPPLRWMLWGGAASAFVTTVAIGLVNTTLHHEHGLLAMLFLGCWLGSERRRAAPAAEPLVGITVTRRYDRTSIGD